MSGLKRAGSDVFVCFRSLSSLWVNCESALCLVCVPPIPRLSPPLQWKHKYYHRKLLLVHSGGRVCWRDVSVGWFVCWIAPEYSVMSSCRRDGWGGISVSVQEWEWEGGGGDCSGFPVRSRLQPHPLPLHISSLCTYSCHGPHHLLSLCIHLSN